MARRICSQPVRLSESTSVQLHGSYSRSDFVSPMYRDVLFTDGDKIRTLVADFPANFNVGSREQDMIRSVDEPSWYIAYDECRYRSCSPYAMRSIAISVLLAGASNSQIRATFGLFRPVWRSARSSQISSFRIIVTQIEEDIAPVTASS